MAVNPFNQLPDVQLLPGEAMAPLNPYTNKGYMILPYYYVTTFGRYFSTATGKLEEKKLQFNTSSYHEICVATTAGQKHLLAHRGVLATFCPIFNMNDFEIDHINGNHLDNRLENLRWVTSQQNNIAAHETGINPPRSRSISDETIKDIMLYAYSGYSDREIYQKLIEKEVRISEDTIRHIRTGSTIYGDILKELGLSPVRHTEHTYLSKDDYEKIAEMYKSGMSGYRIARELNISESAAKNTLVKMFGPEEYRDRNNLVRLDLQNTSEPIQKNKDPFVFIPQKLINNGINLYPINQSTSELHIIDSSYAITKEGVMYSMARGNKWKELVPNINYKGYATVGLNTNHGNKQFMIHRIMMATFCPRDDMYSLEVNHINGIKNDNRLENLEWITHTISMQKAAIKNADNRPIQRAPDEDIIQINKLAWEGKSDKEISEILNGKYTPNNISIIRAGHKTYGPVLEKLGLKPFKQHVQVISPETRQEICDFIVSGIMQGKPLMGLYDQAGAKFGINSSTVRKIYSEFK